MNNIQTQHIYRADLNQCPLSTELERPLSHTDALADEFVICVRRGMTPADLTGMTVLGCITWGDRTTLPLRGTVQGSSAVLTLPEEAYAYPGAFTLTVQLEDGDVRHTLVHLQGQIARTSGDTLIPSDGVLPTLPEFLQHMEAMDAATAAAQEAADDVRAAADDMARQTAAVLADLTGAIQQAGPAIICEAGGSLPHCSDAAARPACTLVSTLAAAQPGTGDPSPDNVRPINGVSAVSLFRAGRNLLGFKDFTATASAYVDTCEGGMFRREVTAAHNTSYVVSATGMGNIVNPHIPAGTYTFTLTRISGVTYPNPYVEVTLSDSSVVKLASGVATTLPMAGTITGIRMDTAPANYKAGDTAEFVLQLEAGETSTAYEPYNGLALTAALPETVYGGMLDWTTGMLTVTHFAMVYNGSEAWEATTAGTAYKLPNGVPGTALVANHEYHHLCSHYRPTHYKDVQDDKTCFSLNSSNLIVKDTSIGLLDSFKAFLAAQAAAGTPMTIVWQLKPANYTTLQLDPQTLDMLKGYNTVWSDAGETSLVYIADTKMYIDNAVAALAASCQQA